MTCPREIEVGAFVLDALEPGEQLRMQQHVGECPVCAGSLRELEGLPALMAGVPVPDEPPRPSELAYSRLRRQAGAVPVHRHAAHRARRSVRQWSTRRLMAVAAAAVVVVGGGVTGAVVASHSPATTAPSTLTATAGKVHLSATITPDVSGSTIALTFDNVPSGWGCTVYAVSKEGRWATASKWTAEYPGTAYVNATVPIRPGDLDRLVIRALDGRTLANVPA